MNPSRAAQIWTIARLQLTRVFFSKRSFWVYLLAIFPSVIFLGHGIETKITRARYSRSITNASILESIRDGETDEEILKRAPGPINDYAWSDRRRPRGKGFKGGKGPPPNDPETVNTHRYLGYFDGTRRWDLNFDNNLLQSKRNQPLVNMDEDRSVFAAVFQHFYLRLAVFFGCLGIFMNLFRGEMLDKTLHFWFLAPVRRDVLLSGKYLAGLITAITIFTAGAALSYGAMLWAQDTTELATFWRNQGLSHLLWYMASAALGAAGYGSVFLAAGLLLRNPIVPAIVLLVWEGINGVLPNLLQKLSVLYYVQSLAPMPVPVDADAPLLIRLLTSPAEPPPAILAVLGLCGVTALVLFAASRAVKRLEIDYGTE